MKQLIKKFAKWALSEELNHSEMGDRDREITFYEVISLAIAVALLIFIVVMAL